MSIPDIMQSECEKCGGYNYEDICPDCVEKDTTKKMSIEIVSYSDDVKRIMNKYFNCLSDFALKKREVKTFIAHTGDILISRQKFRKIRNEYTEELKEVTKNMYESNFAQMKLPCGCLIECECKKNIPEEFDKGFHIIRCKCGHWVNTKVKCPSCNTTASFEHYSGKDWAWYFYKMLGYRITDGEEDELALKLTMDKLFKDFKVEIDGINK